MCTHMPQHRHTHTHTFVKQHKMENFAKLVTSQSWLSSPRITLAHSVAGPAVSSMMKTFSGTMSLTHNTSAGQQCPILLKQSRESQNISFLQNKFPKLLWKPWIPSTLMTRSFSFVSGVFPRHGLPWITAHPVSQLYRQSLSSLDIFNERNLQLGKWRICDC